jgi:hypothetical protein
LNSNCHIHLRYLKVIFVGKNMAFSITKQMTSLSVVFTMTLVACGGGGGSGAAPRPTADSAIRISGLVAKQVAFAGASVKATNSTVAVGSAVTVATDGGYTFYADY